VKTHPFIEAEKLSGRNVARTCELLEVSRAAFYARRGDAPSQRATTDVTLVAEIRQIHATSGGTYGSPRVHAELCDRGRDVGKGESRASCALTADAAGVRPPRRITWPAMLGRRFVSGGIISILRDSNPCLTMLNRERGWHGRRPGRLELTRVSGRSHLGRELLETTLQLGLHASTGGQLE
jgi:hypothetical protein